MDKRTRNLTILAVIAAAGVGVDQLIVGGEAAEDAAPAPAVSPRAEPPAPAAARGPAPAPAPAARAAGPGAAAPLVADSDAADADATGRVDLRLLRDGPAVSEAEPVNPFRDRFSAPAVAAPVAAKPSMDVPKFLARRPLAAVLGEGANARAVVAGEVLRVGDTRDGMTLEMIRGRYVVWSGAGVRFAAGLRAAERRDRTATVEAPVADPVAALFDR